MGFPARGTLPLVLAIAIIISLLSGGVLHSIVPHSHGGASHALWVSLHSGLRHEDKQPVALPPVPAELGVISAALLVIAYLAGSALRESRGTAPEALRRGIFAYRRFG